jgi:hypothetical protein
MPNFEGFRERNSERPELYSYDSITVELKIQLNHIWNEFFEQPEIPDFAKEQIFTEMEKAVCRRIPLEYLPSYADSGLELFISSRL